jgi:glycosyltransferase involved in cell wall biosynthesis
MTRTGTRVLMIDSETTWRGGEGQLWLLMKGLERAGYEVTLAAPDGSAIGARAAQLGVDIAPLTITGGFDVGAAWRLRGLLRGGDYDIVHTHSSHAHGVAFMACRMLTNSPRLVVSRRVDFRIARNAFSAIKYRYGADVYIAISKGVRNVLIEGGIAPERTALVRSGIDLSKFDGVGDPAGLRAEFGLEADVEVVGNVAALAPHKSQVDLVRAARVVLRQIPDARFFIVGDGELRGTLEELIEELGLEGKVTLTGFRDDALRFIGMFDCFVLSSYLEGLCTSVMDAQAMGTPVVATNTGGVPDLVEHGRTGLLVEPSNPESLAEGITRMLREPDLGRRCAEAARRQALAEYDARHMVEGTMEVYDRLLTNAVKVQ